jgi:hypothetical protein
MPKDEKPMTRLNPPQELPMPKYNYQKAQGGSVSSQYKDDEARKQEPTHELHNVRFG